MKKTTFQALEVHVVSGRGSDKVMIKIDRDSGTYPYEVQGCWLTMEVAAGSAAAYLEKHWPELLQLGPKYISL